MAEPFLVEVEPNFGDLDARKFATHEGCVERPELQCPGGGCRMFGIEDVQVGAEVDLVAGDGANHWIRRSKWRVSRLSMERLGK